MNVRLARWVTVVYANFVKIKLNLVDQANSNNLASSGDVSTDYTTEWQFPWK